MNGFRFFSLGFDLPPRTSIGYLVASTVENPETRNCIKSQLQWKMYLYGFTRGPVEKSEAIS